MAKVSANKETYTAIANGSWKKQDELRALKGEAAELDRRIALTLAPPEEEKVNSNENDQSEYLRQNNSNSQNTKKEDEVTIYSSAINNRNKQEESKGYIVKSKLK